MQRALLAVLALCAAVALVFGAFGLVVGHKEERDHTVSGAITRIEVAGAAGDVSVLGASVRDVTIHEARRSGWRRPRFELVRAGSVLRVSVRCPALAGRCSDDLAIVVPRRVRDGVVRTDSGDVSLAGLLDANFRVTSLSGNVRATRSTGVLGLSSASGVVVRD